MDKLKHIKKGLTRKFKHNGYKKNKNKEEHEIDFADEVNLTED